MKCYKWHYEQYEMRRHFGGASVPSPVQTPAAVKSDDPAVQQAAAEALRRKAMQKGYQSTILSSMLSPDTQRNLKATLGS